MTVEEWPAGFPELVAAEALKSKNKNARRSGKPLVFTEGHFLKILEAKMGSCGPPLKTVSEWEVKYSGLNLYGDRNCFPYKWKKPRDTFSGFAS
jgi:hypothetical protein